MTNEEAIKKITRLLKFSTVEEKEVLRMAIAALRNRPEESNTGKQVEFAGDCCDAGLIIDSAVCPTCGYLYDLGDPDWGEPFCPHCGQKLLWEVTTNDE